MAADAMRLAKRLDEVGFSDIVQVRNKVMELRAAGQKVHAFHGGEPFFDTPEPIKYAMMKALVENKTRYAPSSGIEPLRTALAKKLQTRNAIEATAEDVIVTAGGAGNIIINGVSVDDMMAQAAGQAAAAADPTAQLTRLADLHERGVLNDEEFASQKAKILGG